MKLMSPEWTRYLLSAVGRAKIKRYKTIFMISRCNRYLRDDFFIQWMWYVSSFVRNELYAGGYLFKYQIQKEQPNIYNDYIICITILSVLQSLSLQSLLLFNVILSNINFIITITWPLRVRLCPLLILTNFLLNQARESYGQAKSYIWTENLDSRRISRLGCY